MKLLHYLIFLLCSASFAADSSNIYPAQTTKNEYPVSNVFSASTASGLANYLANEDYWKYPCCPGSPNGNKPNGDYDYCGPLGTTIKCGDINTPDDLSTCPRACVVTRVIGGIEQRTDSSGKTFNVVTSVADAVCPLGYAAVSTFNMGSYQPIAGSALNLNNSIQNELIWSTNRAPITNLVWSQLNGNMQGTLPATGYQCTVVNSAYSPGATNYGPWNGTLGICRNGGSGVPDWGFTDGTNWYGPVGVGGGVNVLASGSGATFQGQPSNYVYYYQYYGNECRFGSGCGGGIDSTCPSWTTRWYKYDRYLAICYPPAGLQITSLNQPISVLCARVNMKWR